MQETAQQKIRKLFHSNSGNRPLFYDFDLYDISVSQKLWSTDYYCRQLLSISVNQFHVLPSPSETQSSGSAILQTPMLDISSYCRYLNLHLDGFFMNSMSALDTLAHELFILYQCHQIPRNIYIGRAKDMLLNEHPYSAVGALLNVQLSKPWFTEFEPFRHCTTHESLIRYSDIIYRFDHVTGQYKLSRKIKLPDNPQVKPFTYNKNRVASKYCQSIFNKISWLINNVHGCTLRDIRARGNIVPIPP